jgi:hypothetical protein
MKNPFDDRFAPAWFGNHASSRNILAGGKLAISRETLLRSQPLTAAAFCHYGTNARKADVTTSRAT